MAARTGSCRPRWLTPAGAGARRPSVSIWADGSAGLVLPAASASASSGAIIGWQASGWRMLPRLPVGTATLAVGPGGQPQALTVTQAAMTAWQLGPGSSQWTAAQTVHV